MIVAYNALSVRPGVFDGAATFTLNLLHHLPDALPEARFVVLARQGESRLGDSARLTVRALPVAAWIASSVRRSHDDARGNRMFRRGTGQSVATHARRPPQRHHSALGGITKVWPG